MVSFRWLASIPLAAVAFRGRRQLSRQGSCDTIKGVPMIMNYMPLILATAAILAVFAFAAEVSSG
jgi:hypothetical protein